MIQLNIKKNFHWYQLRYTSLYKSHTGPRLLKIKSLVFKDIDMYKDFWRHLLRIHQRLFS